MRQFNISLGSLVLTVQNFWCWTFIQHRSLNKVIAILCTIWEQHFLLEISTLPSYHQHHWNMPNSGKKKRKERIDPKRMDLSKRAALKEANTRNRPDGARFLSQPDLLVLSSKAAKDPVSPLNKGENTNIGIKCIEKNLFQIEPLNENLWYFCVEA